MERVHALVVGAGPAGLAVSHQLSGLGIEHVVLERERIGQSWRERWDNFVSVTPNWSFQLPGGAYAGDDPDGYMPRDEIVLALERYAARSGAPVREGVEVRSLEATPSGGFVARTSEGQWQARHVVACTGSYRLGHRPSAAGSLPVDVAAFDLDDYRDPNSLPPGRVLVVGSGQSGCQVAEELHEAGRDVVLSCGRAPWAPRRIDGRDTFWWAAESGFLDARVESLPSPSARLAANILATGRQGGHDLHLRTLRAMGVMLVGHLTGVDDAELRFAPDLGPSVAWGDERYLQLATLIRRTAERLALPMPHIPDPEPFDPDAPEVLALDGFGSVLFAGGFRPDYRSWLPWPDAFDEMGFPIQEEGASSVIDGLWFAGVHFQRKRKSAVLLGMGEDAAIVASGIAARGQEADA